MRDHTTASNSCLNKSVKLFISSDRKLQVAWGNTLYLEIFAGISSKFENLSGEVF
jgi:hypothetical protein